LWEEVLLRQKKDYAGEFRIILPDGTVKYLAATSHHTFSAGGEILERLGTHIDVTERKRAREEHERLRQLESDLAHMNRLGIIGEQAASLVHEITQPIATARNNARAALNFLDRKPPELGQLREALACVVDDADRAREIIDWTRDHIRKAPPRKARFDLNDAIDEVIVLGRSEITKNGVLVQTRLTEGLYPARGDRVQLQQVILNLVLNAVQAMSSVEAGPRELLISTEQTEANGVLVAVRDSGPGIDPEHVERVFEAFYTTKSSGAGMGLSICRSIIDAHGGRLWAKANEPRGRYFYSVCRSRLDAERVAAKTRRRVPASSRAASPTARRGARDHEVPRQLRLPTCTSRMNTRVRALLLRRSGGRRSFSFEVRAEVRSLQAHRLTMMVLRHPPRDHPAA
jgi:signal transduction histidine kinase